MFPTLFHSWNVLFTSSGVWLCFFQLPPSFIASPASEGAAAEASALLFNVLDQQRSMRQSAARKEVFVIFFVFFLQQSAHLFMFMYAGQYGLHRA